ncbi:MAG: tetratricopeptide repeat protein [Bacteroidia bacterium]
MKAKILLFYFLLFNAFIYGQGRIIDSLKAELNNPKEDTSKVKTLNELSWKFVLKNDSAALPLAVQAKQLAEKLGFKKGVVRAYNNLGVFAMNKGNYREALDAFLASLKICREINFPKGLAIAFQNSGTVYLYLGNYPEALKYYFSALKIYDERNDKNGIASSNNNIAGIYAYQGNYDEAIKYYQSSLRIKETTGDKKGMGNSYNNIGGAYELKKNYPEALKNYLTALKIYEEIEDVNGIASCKSNIALNYSHNNDLAHAIEYETNALEMRRSLGDKDGIANSSIHLGEWETDIKAFSKATEHLHEALAIALAIGNKESVKNSYFAQSRLSEALGDYKNSLVTFKNYITYRDSLNNEQNTKKSVEEKLKYDFDKKQALLDAEQEKKDAIANQEKQKQKYILLGVITVLLLVFVFSIFLYKRFKITQRQKHIIESQKEVVERKNNIIEEKQKEILDSINYARRIQLALLASDNLLTKHLPDYFVFFKPKDIVAGDFYWATSAADGFIYITADCTGHGVPGAFMSLLNISKLSEAINQKQITRPDLILNDVRNEIISALNPPGSQEESKDGMDCILCNIDVKEMKLRYASANNTMVVFRNGQLLECKADKMPVGKYTETLTPFTLNEIALEKGDIIYTFTDGFIDQFGGVNGKKLKYKPFASLLFSIAHLPMSEQKTRLEQEFEKWRGVFDQVDDVCVMGVRV